jgi:hypothetical protein
MAKKRRTKKQLSPAQVALLAKFSPAVELTPLIRPGLVLMAPLATGQLLLGLLYHTRKQAWQWRLRVRSATHPGFSQRGRWRQYPDAQALETYKQAMRTAFAELAARLGAAATLQLEFPLQTTDGEILQALARLEPFMN